MTSTLTPDAYEHALLVVLHDYAPLTLEELARELHDPLDDVAVAVSALTGAGLVHSAGPLLLLTRAARRFAELVVP